MLFKLFSDTQDRLFDIWAGSLWKEFEIGKNLPFGVENWLIEKGLFGKGPWGISIWQIKSNKISNLH